MLGFQIARVTHPGVKGVDIRAASRLDAPRSGREREVGPPSPGRPVAVVVG